MGVIPISSESGEHAGPLPAGETPSPVRLVRPGPGSAPLQPPGPGQGRDRTGLGRDAPSPPRAPLGRGTLPGRPSAGPATTQPGPSPNGGPGSGNRVGRSVGGKVWREALLPAGAPASPIHRGAARPGSSQAGLYRGQQTLPAGRPPSPGPARRRRRRLAALTGDAAATTGGRADGADLRQPDDGSRRLPEAGGPGCTRHNDPLHPRPVPCRCEMSARAAAAAAPALAALRSGRQGALPPRALRSPPKAGVGGSRRGARAARVPPRLSRARRQRSPALLAAAAPHATFRRARAARGRPRGGRAGRPACPARAAC